MVAVSVPDAPRRWCCRLCDEEIARIAEMSEVSALSKALDEAAKLRGDVAALHHALGEMIALLNPHEYRKPEAQAAIRHAQALHALWKDVAPAPLPKEE